MKTKYLLNHKENEILEFKNDILVRYFWMGSMHWFKTGYPETYNDMRKCGYKPISKKEVFIMVL